MASYRAATEISALREMGIRVTAHDGHLHIAATTHGLWYWANFIRQELLMKKPPSTKTFSALAKWKCDPADTYDLHLVTASMAVHDSERMYYRPTVYLAGSPIQLIHDFAPCSMIGKELIANGSIGTAGYGDFGLTAAHTLVIEFNSAEVDALSEGRGIMVNPIAAAGRLIRVPSGHEGQRVRLS